MSDEFFLVKNIKAKAQIWELFTLKKFKHSQKTLDNLAVCSLCEMEVIWKGYTCNF